MRRETDEGKGERGTIVRGEEVRREERR